MFIMVSFVFPISAKGIRYTNDSKISKYLENVFAYDTSISQRVMIWLKDIDTDSAVRKAWTTLSADTE